MGRPDPAASIAAGSGASLPASWRVGGLAPDATRAAGRQMEQPMYAYDIHAGDDWGDGPVYSSSYDYPTPLTALDAALDWIDAHDDLDRTDDAQHIGVYVWGEPTNDDEGPGWQWSPGRLPEGPILSSLDSVREDVWV